MTSGRETTAALNQRPTHPSFQQPPDLAVPVWRYIDLPRLISLLSTRSLYFCRIDQFDDVHEGTLPQTIHDWIEQRNNRVRQSGHKIVGTMDDTYTSGRKDCYANCWCIQRSENHALWSIYGGGSAGGLAIKTTYERLLSSVSHRVFAGVVRYIDFRDPSAYSLTDDSVNVLEPVMLKRDHYDYEREMRLVVWSLHGLLDEQSEFRLTPDLTGLFARVDFDKLQPSLVVSPTSPPWHEDAIRAAVRAFGLNWEVEKSVMAATPLHDKLLVTEPMLEIRQKFLKRIESGEIPVVRRTPATAPTSSAAGGPPNP